MVKWLSVAILTVLAVLMSSSGQGQPSCTVTVQPGQSIQEAIDRASEGAVICISADNFPYMEHLTITKSLTLRGAGPEETILKASANGGLVGSIIAGVAGMQIEKSSDHYRRERNSSSYLWSGTSQQRQGLR